MQLLIGTILTIAAMLLVLTVVLNPQPDVPLERRRPYKDESVSSLSRLAGSSTDAVNRYLSKNSLKLFNRESLENAGLKHSQADFLILVLSASLASAVIGFLAGGFPGAVVLFLLTPAGARFMVTQRAGKRRAKFDAQLGDTLQLLTGSLRAGHSILRAIDAAAVESAAPTSEEMRRVVTETSLGKDLLSSLNDTAARMRNEDFMWIAQAIQINREVGGNLAEVLDQVNETIRERSEIKGQIKSLAAEGKFSAYILMAMPFCIVAMLLLISPGYMTPLFSSPLGWTMIGVSAVLMTIGGLWMRKIIDLKF
ncbi:type II secretion system F family protein [Arthrobacter sp. TMN-50]